MRLSKIPAGFWPVQSREHLWPHSVSLIYFFSAHSEISERSLLSQLGLCTLHVIFHSLSAIALHVFRLKIIHTCRCLEDFFFFASLLNTKSLGIWLVFIVAEVCVEVGRRDPVGKNTLLFLCSWHQLLHLICLCRALCLCRLLFYFWQFPLHYGSPSLSYLESYQEIRCERWTWPTSLVQTNY